MKARQYKKLCKKAMEILIEYGMDSEAFSREEDAVRHNGRQQWFQCWGLNTGPDYFGECDWFDAWFILSKMVSDDTADWESCTGADGDNPYKTSIADTRGVLQHGRLMADRMRTNSSKDTGGAL